MLRGQRLVVAACAGVAVGGIAVRSDAAPYASGVTEAAGNVTFRLNEPADEVVIIRDGVSQSLGPQGLGSHTFARNGAANYSIVARKNSAGGYTENIGGLASVLQISDDNSELMSFFAPRGVTVNTNPANGALFGRIYVSNATEGTTVGLPTPIRDTGDGIYVLNPDRTDALGQGSTALNGGLTFGAAASPWRLALDDAGFLYIADWEDDTGTVYRTDANVAGGVNMLAGQGAGGPIAPDTTLNHGSVGGLAVRGSLAGGNLTLWTVDEDLSPSATADDLNSLWRYNVNGGPLPHSAVPTLVANNILIDDFAPGGIIVDVARDPSATKFYMMQSRSDGNEPGVSVVNASGVELFDSLQASQERNVDGNPGIDGIQDVLRLSRGIEVSPDGRYMAISLSASDVRIVPLLAGIPDIANTYVLDAFPDVAAGRDVAFDAAGNLYAISSGNQAMRVFSPGGLSVTAFNSNGTFVMDPSYTAGAGNYSTTASWLADTVPNGANHVARFAGAGGNVNMDTAVTLGAIKFDSTSAYTLAGSNTITLRGSSPNVMSLRGSHTIAAPLLLTQSTGLVANGGQLTINNLNVDPAATVPVEVFTGGTGSVSVNRVRAEALNVVEGTTRILPNGTNSGTSNVKRLRISGGTSPIAKLDVTNNAFVVDYTDTSPLDTIRAQITSAYAGGAWTGNGITSSNANAAQFGVGYGEASAVGAVPAIFGTVDATAVLFRETRYGDANLDGQVNLSDFNRLAANFGSTSGVWTQGDFNYDGNVNLQDFNRLAANFGLSAAGPTVTPDDWARLGAAVPEPAGASVLAVGMLALSRRARRRSRA